jgi:hypothetical protein
MCTYLSNDLFYFNNQTWLSTNKIYYQLSYNGIGTSSIMNFRKLKKNQKIINLKKNKNIHQI